MSSYVIYTLQRLRSAVSIMTKNIMKTLYLSCFEATKLEAHTQQLNKG